MPTQSSDSEAPEGNRGISGATGVPSETVAAVVADGTAETPPKRGRGRPRKVKPEASPEEQESSKETKKSNNGKLQGIPEESEDEKVVPAEEPEDEQLVDVGGAVDASPDKAPDSRDNGASSVEETESSQELAITDDGLISIASELATDATVDEETARDEKVATIAEYGTGSPEEGGSSTITDECTIDSVETGVSSVVDRPSVTPELETEARVSDDDDHDDNDDVYQISECDTEDAFGLNACDVSYHGQYRPDDSHNRPDVLFSSHTIPNTSEEVELYDAGPLNQAASSLEEFPANGAMQEALQRDEAVCHEGGSDQPEGDQAAPGSFVEKLDHYLKSKRTRLPESFYGEDVYSIVDNTKLPEGCKTVMDFFNMPKNFDFKSFVDLSIRGSNSGDGLSAYGNETLKKVENPVYTGKYPESLFDYIFEPTSPKRRYTTSKGKPEAVNLGEVYDDLKQKKMEDLMPKEEKSPIQRIREDCFMFDTYHYIRHYLQKINKYNYDVVSSHHRDDGKLTYYLNHEYIQRVPKLFPPGPDHTERVREYFMGLLPEVMDNLVNLIKNDPNKNKIPSPPLHDMALAPGFELPDYMRPDYHTDDTRTGGYQEEDFLKYSSLEGLHNPSKHLYYPYADVEPLYQRQLLSVYLDIVKTGELGEPETYKKYRSRAASIRNEMYPDQTKLPQDIYRSPEDERPEKRRIDGKVTLTKVYEKGTRKSSVALVYLEPGNGNIIINNRDGYQYVRYCTQRLREMLEPLDALYIYKKFNIVAMVHGGGISGQAGAIRYALARYLTRVFAPKLEPYLKLRDLTKPDTRQVERKKTNLRKARKQEHYSKR